jgi:hypothetical protein
MSCHKQPRNSAEATYISQCDGETGFALRHRLQLRPDYRELILAIISRSHPTSYGVARSNSEDTMKLKPALVGLFALGGAVLTAGTASAMPIGLATDAEIASNIDQVRLLCNAYGRCWRTPGYAYNYYGGPSIRFGHGGGYRRHDHGYGYGHGHGYGDRRW